MNNSSKEYDIEVRNEKHRNRHFDGKCSLLCYLNIILCFGFSLSLVTQNIPPNGRYLLNHSELT